jgi:GT2 family glycosyltransferase
MNSKAAHTLKAPDPAAGTRLAEAAGDEPLHEGSATRPVRVVAAMTCFNRKALTLACLDSLSRTAGRAGVELHAVLVDDASSDGTARAVRDCFPWVEVLGGSGTLFWNRGMHQAFKRAMEYRADHYLWINDDTHLLPDALAGLLAQSAELTRRERRPVIVVGATAEPGSGTISYGGRVAHSRMRPFNYKLVWSESQPMPCQAIEGNCVLIPREVAERVGNLDPAFEHAMGDTDYGLRALQAGFKSFVAKGIAGHCSPNSPSGTYFDTSLPLATRWKLIKSRKGLPVRSWLRFCRRHGGWLWPLYFAWPYFKVLATSARGPTAKRAPVGTAPGPSHSG